MTTALAPYAGYEAPVQAYEYEGEWESEHEDEDEAEEFFGALASLASRALSNPTLRRVGLGAARAALNAGGRALSERTGGFSGQAASYLSSLLPQSELEAEDEGEDFVDPYRRVYPNRSLMEHIGHVATEAEDEDEAEALASSLVPLAARHAPALHRASPQLTRAVATVARQLRANPSTRPLVRALPAIVHRTANTVNRQAAAGRRITPQHAVRALAHHTARTLGSPQQLVRDFRRSQRLEQHHHVRRAAGPGYRGGVGWHPGYRFHPYGAAGRPARYGGPGWRWPVRPAPSGVTHQYGPQPHAHVHPQPAGPGPAESYGPWRRYAPPPGTRAPVPPPAQIAVAPPAPVGYPGPAAGTWNCTCQCG
jgi:hypothetical protein